MFHVDRLPKLRSNPSGHSFLYWTASWCNASSLTRCDNPPRFALLLELTGSSSTSTPLPEATVIAVGPGAPNKEGQVVPTTVKPGDRVLLPGWGGNSIKEYFLFKDSEILAKIQE
ncbi:hypothetical protein V8B97DRAFT_1916166 [Scleroderma yunnanense]